MFKTIPIYNQYPSKYGACFTYFVFFISIAQIGVNRMGLFQWWVLDLVMF